MWIEGGQVKSENDLWSKICYELNYPLEVTKKLVEGNQVTISGAGGVEAGIPGNKASFILTTGGFKLLSLDWKARIILTACIPQYST